MNDTELRERLAGFYSSHWRGLWAFIVRMGTDAATAEDVAQDSFAKWALSPAAGWEERRAKAYLYTIAVRGLIDYKRRTRREEPLGGELAVGGTTPDRLLGNAWRALSDRDRQLLWLAHAEEFSHSEIAEIIGVRAGSIKVLLSRARERARKSIIGDES